MKGACGAPPMNLTVSDLPSPAALNGGSTVQRWILCTTHCCSALPSAFVGHVGKSFDIKSGTFRQQLGGKQYHFLQQCSGVFYPYLNKTFAVPDVLSVANTPAAGIRFDGVIYGNISSVINTWLHGAFDGNDCMCWRCTRIG